MDSPVYVVSDIHLGAVPDATERAFIAFLERVGADAGALLLPGDLFDFWFEYGKVIPGKHFRVLAALSRLVEAGIPVTMVAGNHDAWGGAFLRDEVGIDYYVGDLRVAIADRPALVAHGDGVGSGDLKYRALKAVIRSRAAIAAFRVLHPELGVRLAQAVSATEGKADRDPAVQGRAAYIEAWARERLAEEPELGWVVCGHAHLPALEEVEPGRYYMNAGDWIMHRSYIRVGVDGTPELLRWKDDR
jgi:UDP-2,3-diacylglucosamine hydrolase